MKLGPSVFLAASVQELFIFVEISISHRLWVISMGPEWTVIGQSRWSISGNGRIKRLKVAGHIPSWKFCENGRSSNQKFDGCLTKIVYFPVHHRFRPFILIQMTVPFGPRPSTFISSNRSFLTWLTLRHESYRWELDNKNLKALNDDQIASFGCQSGTFYQYSVRKVFWSRIGWIFVQSEWVQMKTCSVMEMAMKEMLPPQAMATMVAIQITTCHAIRKR